MGRLVRCGNRIPPPQAVVDWSHPLADGLIGFYAFVGRHPLLSDATGLTTPSFVGSVQSVETSLGCLTPEAVAGLRLTDQPADSADTRWTWTVRWLTRTQSAWTATVMGYRGSPSPTTFRKLTPNGWENYVSGAQNGQITYVFPNRWGTASVVKNGPSFALFHDRRLVGTSSPTLYSGAIQVCLSSDPATNEWRSAWYEFAALHSRPLSAHEVAWLHDEPYAMFVVERPRTVFVMGTGFRPWQVRRPKVLGGGILR